MNRILRLFLESDVTDWNDILFDKPGDKTASDWDIEEPEVEKENIPNAKKAGNIKIIKSGTPLYHGAHKERSGEIITTKKLLARSPHKTSGGLTTEGGLLWFSDNINKAKQWSTGEMDPIAASGTNRKQGSVFVYKPEKNLKLIKRNHRLSSEEATKVNEILKMSDYKKMQEGDRLSSAVDWRYSAIKIPYQTYRTNNGEMMVLWPILLHGLGYDGFYDDSGIALAYDKNIDIEELK